ncbi:unnamed protein product [Gadus morhua 'NCC']
MGNVLATCPPRQPSNAPVSPLTGAPMYRPTGAVSSQSAQVSDGPVLLVHSAAVVNLNEEFTSGKVAVQRGPETRTHAEIGHGRASTEQKFTVLLSSRSPTTCGALREASIWMTAFHSLGDR